MLRSLFGRARRRKARSRGQSVVEFALILPIVLTLLLITVDFGRVYLGYINLQNMARIAANYAAGNSTAWDDGNTAALTRYQNLVLEDAAASNCDLPKVGGVTTVPAPTFPSGTDVGGQARVEISCTFKLVTPFLDAVFSGGTVHASANAVFPIRTGLVATGSAAPGSPPNAAFSATPTSVAVGGTVQFNDESNVGNAWLWDFGDETTSTDQNPTHSYAETGSYDVTLTVWNMWGASVPKTKTGYITVGAAAAAAFSGSPVSGPYPLAVQFTDQSSPVPTSWSWNFGDGATSTAQNPLHSYAHSGSYSVSLTVQSTLGASTVTKSAYITVSSPSCVVPNLVTIRRNDADAAWTNAHFSGSVSDAPNAASGNYKIAYQSITGLSSAPCDSGIQVSDTAP